MRRVLAIVLGGLVLCSLGGGAAAADVDWTSLPYVDALNMREKVSTDSSWSGSTAIAAPAPLGLQQDPSWPKLKRQWIWSSTCGPAAQRVVFSKTVLVPGEPLTAQLGLMYGPGNQYYGGRPYVSASFLVNGIEIGRLGDVAHHPRTAASALSVQLDARDRKAFHYGANTLTIRVERAALKKGEHCTRPAATSGGNVRYIAIGADLSLGFGSDLQAVPPAVAQQVRKNVKNGDVLTISGTVAFQNAGPSANIGGNLLVNVNGDGTALIVKSATAPNLPLDSSRCTVTDQQMQCKYAVIPAGYSLSIRVTVGIKAETGLFRNGAGKLTIMWSITGPGPDPGTKPNNTTQTVVIMCAVGATNPACA